MAVSRLEGRSAGLELTLYRDLDGQDLIYPVLHKRFPFFTGTTNPVQGYLRVGVASNIYLGHCGLKTVDD